MGQWIELTEAKPPQFTQHGAKGLKVNLYASPYDMPVAARGGISPDRTGFTIELRYLTEGEPTTDRDEGMLRLSVGRRSGRIHRIRVNLAERPVDAVGLQVQEIQDEVAHTLRSPRHGEQLTDLRNADAVRAALEFAPQIYSELAQAH